ncbi:unnamed protein product [Rodentolepis nana]|uniref:Coiled-coil domain-containing protein n=1 Tax=Rodentolepis nana TaxID=102285 RepID=A0A0R3TJB5_RODNA|nr:unnamed protein product [Rodentolepis nana]
MKDEIYMHSVNTTNVVKPNYVPKSTTQLALSINESSRGMNISQQQLQKSIISEAPILQEIQEMEEVLLQNAKNRVFVNHNDIILQHLQNTVRKLSEKINDISESLQSISTDVSKLQSANIKNTYLKNANINKSINYLNKHIKDLTPKIEDSETQLRLILTILRSFALSNSSKHLRIDKIENHLKYIYSSMKRQGLKDKPIVSEIKEVLGLLKQSKGPVKQTTNQNIIGDIIVVENSLKKPFKLNKNENNGSIASSNEVQRIPEIENMSTQIDFIQPEELQDCWWSNENIYTIKPVSNTFQAVRSTKKSSHAFPEFQQTAPLDACKKYGRKSKVCTKVQSVNVNQSNNVNYLKSTPELVSIMNKIKAYIQQIRPEVEFVNNNILTTLHCIVKCIKDLVQTCQGDARTMRAILALLKCMEYELYKQEGSAELLLREVIQLRKHMEVVYNYSTPKIHQKKILKIDANPSISERSGKLVETPILKCLLHRLKGIINQYKPGTQFPQSDFFNHVKCVLDAMIAVTGCDKIDEGTKQQLPKLMQCLGIELGKQKDGSCLLQKVNQIRSNLGSKSKGIDPNKLLCCLVAYLKKLIKKARPHIDIPDADTETLLSFLLDALKDAIQAGKLNSETLRKLPKVMQCIKCCLNANGHLTPVLMAKIQEVIRLLTNQGKKLAQNEHMPTTSDTVNIQKMRKDQCIALKNQKALH